MKYKIFIFGFLFTLFLKAQTEEQKYILLESLHQNHDVKKYTLNAKKLYGVDVEIDVYNIMKENRLLLISVLPDLEKGKTWEEIKIETIEESIISTDRITHRIINFLYTDITAKKYIPLKEFNAYVVLKKKGNKYYKSKLSLFEWFLIVDYPSGIDFSGREFVINLGTLPSSMQEVEEKTKYKLYPTIDFLPDYLRTIYLSEKENDVYRFWTFNCWNVSDGYNVQRGIDRFAYIPGKGIVGGSYDFYFWFKNPRRTRKYKYEVNLSPEQWRQNMYDEKIMWSKELFPEKQ
ncbi:MAG: hypothetical protein Q4G08_07805 [Capnocytophaga sp.]|nr:hypothetical protein [Capnocytophaga sp.]